MEQIDYDLLFRWFVGLSVDDPVWDADRLLQEPRPAAGGAMWRSEFLTALLAQPQVKRLAVERALLGRWHADRGLGHHEELPAEGRRGRPAAPGATASATSPGRSDRMRPTRIGRAAPDQVLWHDKPGQSLLKLLWILASLWPLLMEIFGIYSYGAVFTLAAGSMSRRVTPSSLAAFRAMLSLHRTCRRPCG